jgi:hypothetical protein
MPRLKLIAFPGISHRKPDIARVSPRRTGPAAIIPMPSRLRADMISQKELSRLRTSSERHSGATEVLQNAVASIAERIRLGAKIEPGPEKFPPESESVICQKRLRDLLDDQDCAWLAFCQAHTEALAVRELLSNGARIEPGEITFDSDACKARLAVGPGEVK